MKTLTLLLVAWLLPVILPAQEAGIRFEHNPEWAAMLQKARAEGKKIFMDCYTEWCGPCKLLDKNVFSRADVGDRFNELFVNVKYDMEKGEGTRLQKQYGITAYPTLLFIDPSDEGVVHRVVGAGTAEHLLAQAAIAVEARENLLTIRQRYAASAKTMADLVPFLKTLAAAGMQAERERVVSEFLDNLPPEAWLEEQNWALLENNLWDPLSPQLQRMYAERRAFAKALGAERVNRKLSTALQAAARAFLDKKDADSVRFNAERHAALTRFVLEVEDVVAPECAVRLRAAGHAARKEYGEMMTAVHDALKYNMVQGQLRNVFYMVYLVKLTKCTDKPTLARGVALIDDLVATTADAYIKASFHEIKAMILDGAGDAEGAREAREKGHKRARKE
ncbi:MAG: thioredoxin family protein [Odoribacteraceae bacterium]|jgi:thiol-disulfide isomerase/thioredoxin|nr:thioredoxin family protein [Odoribacteraceae bacterium]